MDTDMDMDMDMDMAHGHGHGHGTWDMDTDTETATGAGTDVDVDTVGVVGATQDQVSSHGDLNVGHEEPVWRVYCEADVVLRLED